MRLTSRGRLWRYLWEQKRWLMLGSACGVVMNTAVVLPPIYLGRLIDAATSGDPGPGWSRLFPPMAALAGALLLYNLPRIGKRYWLRVMANRMNCRLRADILRAVLRYPLARFEGERTGDIMSRAIGDVQVFADTVQFEVTEMYDTVLMMLSSFVALMIMEPRLTLIACAPVPVALVLAQAMGPRIFARALAARQASAGLTEHLHQRIGGVRVLRLLGLEEIMARRFDDLSQRLKRANSSQELLQGGLIPLYSAVAALGAVLVIGQGGESVAAGRWTVGTFSAYVTMFVNMAFRMLVAARMIHRAYAGAAAWSRIEAKLAVPAPELTAYTPGLLAGPVGRLAAAAMVASGLGMSFPTQRTPALGGISFVVPAGSWVGITGPVGSGKSALALVMAGLYPYSGSLTINGRELSSLPAAEKVAGIGYLGQDPFLFSASILDNICLAGAPDQDRLRDALFVAAVEDDLGLFSQALGTPVGELGVRVSGGQRQRIALARALYARTPMLILDDPFSAVDPVTEQEIVLRMRGRLPRTTVIMTSHRLASFACADQVLVLDGGAVRQRGTHEELAATDGLYRRIYRAQAWIEAQEARP